MIWEFNGNLIAHRGASALAPENTFAAFDKALAMGCRCVEFDVMCSADGEPFVFHDDTLSRTTSGKGEVGLADASLLKTLDAGRWFSKAFAGEKIPPFRDMLEWLSFSDVQANIEIKPWRDTTCETTITVLQTLNRYWPQGKPLPLISCFDVRALDLCQSIAPEMPLGFLVDEWKEDSLAQAEKHGCFSIHLNRKVVTAERVSRIKKAGFQLYVYTVNRRRQARKLLEMGVDAIFSDWPDLLS